MYKFSKSSSYVSALALCLVLSLSLSACSSAGQDASKAGSSAADKTAAASQEGQAASSVSDKKELPEAQAAPGYKISTTSTNLVDLMMDSGAHIVIELDPKAAPKTVENFKKLVLGHFYDDLIFHRIIDGFMIQGGDPLGTGVGGAPENIEGEFKSNGVDNPLSHTRGTVSMARAQDPNSASSQFFICNADSQFLDGEYAAFGHVVYGMEEVDRIAKLPKGSQDRPNTPPHMLRVFFVEAQ